MSDSSRFHSLTAEQEAALNTALRLFYAAVCADRRDLHLHAEMQAEARRLLVCSIERWVCAGGDLRSILPGTEGRSTGYLCRCVESMPFPEVVNI